MENKRNSGIAKIFLVTLLAFSFIGFVSASCDSSLNVEITHFGNYNPSGATLLTDISNKIYLGNNPSPVAVNVGIIPLGSAGNSVNDVDTNGDVPGLHIERGSDSKGNYVIITAYGKNHKLSRESIIAKFKFNNATITNVMNGQKNGLNPYERQGDGKWTIDQTNTKNSQPGYDEYFFGVGGNTGSIYSTTNLGIDAVKVYYSYSCPVLPQCSDGIDNDGDGLIDFPADSGCTSLTDNNETDVAPSPSCGDGNLDTGEQCDDGNSVNGDGCSSSCTIELPPVNSTHCSDGIDNDGDGWIDSEDPGCWENPKDSSTYNSSRTSEVYKGTTECSDEKDNDGDGYIDGKDPHCESPEDDDEDGGRRRKRDETDNLCGDLICDIFAGETESTCPIDCDESAQKIMTGQLFSGEENLRSSIIVNSLDGENENNLLGLWLFLSIILIILIVAVAITIVKIL